MPWVIFYSGWCENLKHPGKAKCKGKREVMASYQNSGTWQHSDALQQSWWMGWAFLTSKAAKIIPVLRDCGSHFLLETFLSQKCCLKKESELPHAPPSFPPCLYWWLESDWRAQGETWRTEYEHIPPPFSLCCLFIPSTTPLTSQPHTLLFLPLLHPEQCSCSKHTPWSPVSGGGMLDVHSGVEGGTQGSGFWCTERIEGRDCTPS